METIIHFYLARTRTPLANALIMSEHRTTDLSERLRLAATRCVAVGETLPSVSPRMPCTAARPYLD